MSTILHTVEEFAERVRIGKRTAERLIATGDVPSLKVGRRRFVTEESVERYLKGVATRRGRVA